MRTIAAPSETFRSFLLNLAQIADTVGASLRSRKPTAAPAAVPRHRVRVATSPCEVHEQDAGHRYSLGHDDSARLGRRHVRPRRRPADPLGTPRCSTGCELAGDETGPRRRLRQRPRHRARCASACRAAASSPSTPRRRWSRPPATGSPGSATGSTTSSPTSAGRCRRPGGTGRRDPLDRDLPLGPRPRRPVPRTWPPSSGRAVG